MKEIWKLLTTVTEDPHVFMCGPLATRPKTAWELAFTPLALLGILAILVIGFVVENFMDTATS